MNYRILLIFICLCNCINALPQGNIIPQKREQVELTVPKEKFHIYLLIGQSNMAGRGIVEAQDTIDNPRILRLNRQGAWEIAKDPVHFDKPVAGVGPAMTFAREMLKEDGDIVIGLVPCAAGGSGIDQWKSGEFWEQTKSYPYDDTLVRTRLALKDGTLKGILWHQGESDSDPEKATVYQDKLNTLVLTLRKEFHTPSVPFIAGEIPDFRNNSKDINQAIHNAKKLIPQYDVVSAKGFTPLPDNVHLDARSQREFGKRYAKKMRRMNKNNF